VAARLPQGRTLVIPGAHHELFQETDAIQACVWQGWTDLADRLAP